MSFLAAQAQMHARRSSGALLLHDAYDDDAVCSTPVRGPRARQAALLGSMGLFGGREGKFGA